MRDEGCVFIDNTRPRSFNPEELERDIISLLEQGYSTFYTTLMSDFDYDVVELLMKLKFWRESGVKFYPAIKVVIVIRYFVSVLSYRNMHRVNRFTNIVDRKFVKVVLMENRAFTNASEYCIERCSATL